MELKVDIELNLDIEKVTKEVLEANRMAMRDTVIAVTREAVRNAPPTYKTPWTTGHNRRSIAAEVSGMGIVEKGEDAVTGERMVDDNRIEGAVYSTSGYGGYLETGTSKMPARPYFKPALDMNFTQEKYANKVKEYLKCD